MRIVLDMQGAQTNSRFRGIGRYTVSMAQALLKLKSDHEIFLAFNALMPEAIADVRQELGHLIKEENILIWCGPSPVQENVERNDWRRRVAEECFKTFLQQVQTDLLFVSSYFESFKENAVTCVAEPMFGYATCVVVFDLIPLLNQEQYLFDPLYEANYKRKLNELQQAAAALTISNFSREEALQHLSFRPDQIVNTYLGADSKFRPRAIDTDKSLQIKQTYKLERSFILYAGGSDERKNLSRLIQAYAALPESMRQTYQLLLAGKFSVFDQEHLQKIVFAQGLGEESVRFTGYISDDTLIDLYNLCTLFVFPSWHEGFGLPVLEAMACGAPAIAANCSSLPEVLADPAAMFDPLDIADISRRISEVLGSERLRQSLIDRGIERVKFFSWEKSASIAMKKFEQVLNAAPPKIPIAGSELNHSLRLCYQQLIHRIAALSKSNELVIEDDLSELARCIHRNQGEALRVCSVVHLPDKSTWCIEPSFISTLAPTLVSLGQQVDNFYPLSLPPHQDLKAHEANIYICRLPKTEQDLLPTQVQVAFGLRLSSTVILDKCVSDLNRYVRGIVVYTNFLRKLLVDAGVFVPIAVEPESIAHWTNLRHFESSSNTDGRFRFLCEISDIERDGLDVLLSVYSQSFCSSDKVSLTVLVEPTCADAVRSYLNGWQSSGSAHVEVVVVSADNFIRETSYLQSNCFVAAGRFQDTDTSVNRALALGLPVITTGWGVSIETSVKPNSKTLHTVHYVNYSFARCLKEPLEFNNYWAEPDHQHLSTLMLDCFLTGGSNKVAASTTNSFKTCHLNSTAITLNRLVRKWSLGPTVRPLKIGWITTWNVRCGIATYSEHLIDCISEDVIVLAPRKAETLTLDCAKVIRCWDHTDHQLNDLNAAIKSQGINVIVIQFNYGFFEFKALGEFLRNQVANKVKVVITLHSTVDPVNSPERKLIHLASALNTCHRVLVHSVNDMNRLKQIGLIDNVALFPHGVKETPAQSLRPILHESLSQNANPFTLASYGFFLPHKGLLELIDAVALLRARGINVWLNMLNAEYPNRDSQLLVQQARLKIQALGLVQHVQLTTDFLSDQESMLHLMRSDLVVYPYQQTGESASGAVRFGLAARRPVAVTPLSIFDDVSAGVFQMPGFSPEQISEGLSLLIEGLRSNSEETASKLATANAWVSAHQFSKLAIRLSGILKS